MSGELHPMETRRRSRSKTPFLRSACDHENCEHAGDEGHVHKKRTTASPTVQTIIEETVEVTSSSGLAGQSSKQMTSKLIQQEQQHQQIKTSDYSSEDASPESRLRMSTQQYNQRNAGTKSTSNSKTTTSSSTTTIFTKSKKIGSKNAAVMSSSTPKASFVESYAAQFATGTGTNSVNRQHEISQNELNTAKEKNSSFSRFFGNSFNISGGAGGGGAEQYGNGNVSSDHIAYLEYKRAGEYWKTTPKTDYTYSELSPHRRELAPGVVAMPNMSRRSLENHHERVAYMIQRDPAQEDFIRRRYESSRYAEQRHAAERLTYDSGDEVDVTQFKTDRRKLNQYNEVTWFMRIVTTIITTCTTVWSKIVGTDEMAHKSTMYYTNVGTVERGFFGKIQHGILSVIVGVCRYLYVLTASALCLDTWLLLSSNPDNKNKKRFLLFLLILLPFLLLTAWLLLDEAERLHRIDRIQTMLPLSLLATLKTSLHSTGATFKGFLQMPSLIFSTNTQSATQPPAKLPLDDSMQKTMTPETYENILNHINSYVQHLVDYKIKDQQQQLLKEQQQQRKSVTPEQMEIIVKVMHENLERLAREKRGVPEEVKLSALSEEELLKLVVIIKKQLLATNWPQQPVQLTRENIDEITKLIQQQIQINNHAHYSVIVEKIDIGALLERILSAPQLAEYMDARINLIVDGKMAALNEGSGGSAALLAMSEQQQRLIDDLNNEIAFIKLALADKEHENAALQQSISNLQTGQENLLQRLQQHELATDSRFSTLLAEIERKLATLKEDNFQLLNKQIKLSLIEILGYEQGPDAGAKLEYSDLKHWMQSVFVAKDYLEQRLMLIDNRTNDKIHDEIDRSGMLLMRDISERLKREIMLAVEKKYNDSAATLKGEIRTALSEEEVKKIVKNVLAIYDADKTGLVDFALESAGGSIISTRCTESYQTKSAQISVFGIPLWYPSNTPRVAISPNVQPGECWAFQGFPGFLVLKLNSLVYVTGFTLEHIPKSLAPSGRIDSAPRNFTVWGLEHEKDFDPILFGEYEYVDNDATLQYFPVQNKDINRPYEYVELRIETNHGHPQYTCLYRFRVHGKPPAL